MRRSHVLATVAALVFSGLSTAWSQPAQATAPIEAAGVQPATSAVFVIVGENKSLAQMTSTPAEDPYILKTLKPAGAWFTGYNSATTGSLADYIALTSGQYAECQRHGPCGRFDVPSIFSQLGEGNWQDWNESMPSSCYPHKSGSASTFNFYKEGHNPALWYTNLKTSCPSYDIPTGGTGANDMRVFDQALAAGNVAKYNFIAPNGCESAYLLCGMSQVTSFDNFLKHEIPLIEASPAYGADSLIIVTFDEGHPGKSTMLSVTGPKVVPGTYGGYYDHYSTVATIENRLGLSCLANACTARLLPIFG